MTPEIKERLKEAFGNGPTELTEDEKAEFEAVLGDGFKSEHWPYDLETLPLPRELNDEFWKLSVSLTYMDKDHFDRFLERNRGTGKSDAVLFEEFVALTAKPDDVAWHANNPLKFDQDKLQRHFFDRCRKRLSGIVGTPADLLNDHKKADFASLCEPFSLAWYEFMILHECDYIEFLRKFIDLDLAVERSVAIALERNIAELAERSGSLGRLVQDYRWRVVHGQNALIGTKSAGGSKDGNKARAGRYAARNRLIIDVMEGFIENGHSRRAAARFALNRGFGTTVEGNIKVHKRYA